MKYLDEYREKETTGKLLRRLHQVVSKHWTIMEICGGQTHGLVRNGILEMLPEKITMVHGPGCPVCVTSPAYIDDAIYLALNKKVILTSFGDMLRVPGTGKSLLQAKAEGADIRIVYSPLEALKIAVENPQQEVVFFAVGFETTAPANALSVLHAKKMGLNNFSILASQVLVPPAMEALLSDPENVIDAFLAAGHVCTIMGEEEYYPIALKYKKPIVITGFEPLDLLQGILMAVEQLEHGISKVENQYARVVQQNGNVSARKTINEVFSVSSREWRGIGIIPDSGLLVKDSYAAFDARKKFALTEKTLEENTACISGQIMKGKSKPIDCPNFGTLCKPEHPLGAPMVSSEGACAAYYHFGNFTEKKITTHA